ncbi:DUF885 domain-containing protein [Nocardioides sp.]|uniref:DUF885 domain-containing protein n=1 Tax=Nocardioides sp. TaxID=35761 RepID=UPI0026278F17|nr:DUF885 domain-containing protein [Nocardioides sp.]
MTRQIDARSDRYLAESVVLNPLEATAIGVPGHDHELPDLSPEGWDERDALAREALREVGELTAIDAREELAQAAFVERLGLTVAKADAQLDRSELSVIDGAPHWIRGVLDLMSAEDEESAENLTARLAGVPLALEQYRRTLNVEAAAGRVSAVRQYAETATLIEGWARPGDYFAALGTASPDLPETLRTDLAREAERARVAFADLAGFLRTEMVPRGRVEDGVGREHYALASQYFLGSSIDLEATYAWGWEELARIESEMGSAAHALTGSTDVDAAIALLDADPARNLTSREEFRSWMQARSDEVLTSFHGTHFDIPAEIRQITCTVAPTNDGGAWYTPPTEDFSRPGTMWFSFTDSQEKFSTWRELTTVFHEGVPGHHLQCGQAVWNAAELNRWQRLLCWVSGHGEGWALYAERLMDELGYFADPGDRMGFLDSQAFRAARVVVDIGTHLGLTVPANPWGWRVGERWNADLMLEFMLAHTRMDPSQVRFEVNRYLGWPGQAPSYKVGERIWLEMRDSARAAAGADFDLKAWHTRMLNLGAVPLDLLGRASR